MKNKILLAKYSSTGYSEKAERVAFEKVLTDLRRLPQHIVKKLVAWAQAVERNGIREVRKVPGYHDEPLQGDRQGQRSIRLSRSYRAIYIEEKEGLLTLLILEEVSKHEY